ncbi:MAG TPA: antibiotic biosynthesis monooxygenase [Acidimicrobiales bacterium]|nr:antibiotic biosynthesis monooxygenase [Acidimicrobiales bacterium]
MTDGRVDGQVDDRVVTVFRTRLRSESVAEYEQLAPEMDALARTMPGFVELKTFVADDGERLSLATFSSPETQRAWREHPVHRDAQERGRTTFYDSYDLTVCRIVHHRHFDRTR